MTGRHCLWATGLSPGNLGHDGGIDSGGLIASNQRRHNRAAVAGDKTEGAACADKHKTKAKCSWGGLTAAEDTRTRGRAVNR
jgi:hypothetical protein